MPWWQVEVNVLAKGLKKEQVSVSIEPERLRVAINNPEGEPPLPHSAPRCLIAGAHGRILLTDY